MGNQLRIFLTYEMSFLDESSATLQEALAFIDACEASGSHGAAKPKPSYWQRLREEGERLRRETVALEATLERLQTRRLERVRSHQSHLEREYHRRHHAETTNQQLRSLIIKNREALNTLAKLANVVRYVPVLMRNHSLIPLGWCL